jgi:uncharacterized membrane protein
VLIPLWAALALTAALMVTAVPLVQEKFKADGFALALWNKIFVAVLVLPFLFSVGIPTNPKFYAFVCITGLIYSVSDVIYFRAVPVIGSGMMTRLLPSSVMITFVLWFAVDPPLMMSYLATPWKSGGIAAVMIAFVFFATRVKKCTVSWQGVQLIWPVITAACIGPVFSKIALTHAEAVQAPYAYMFCQSVLTVIFLGGYYAIKKPVTRAVMLSANTLQPAMILGVISAITVFLKTKALQLVDNPGLVSMIFFTDALWVLLVYKLIGRKESGNVLAGLGIVACAVVLILIKSIK